MKKVTAKRRKLQVKRKDVGCPNSHLRLTLVLTPKQIEKMFDALRSTAQLRNERESQYLLKILKDVQRQMVLNDFMELSYALVPR